MCAPLLLLLLHPPNSPVSLALRMCYWILSSAVVSTKGFVQSQKSESQKERNKKQKTENDHTLNYRAHKQMCTLYGYVCMYVCLDVHSATAASKLVAVKTLLTNENNLVIFTNQ